MEICGSDPVHVCISCYKSHQVILHHKPTVSTDSDLKHVLHTTVTQCPSAVTYQDVLNVAITNAVVTQKCSS